VIRLELSADDLRRTRLTFSPLWEAVLSYRLLLGAVRHPLHAPWTDEARRAAGGLDLRAFTALLATGMAFDFMLPVPDQPGRTIDDELDRMRATAIDEVGGEIEAVYTSMERRPPMELQPFVDHSQRALERLADEIAEYWDAVMLHRWPAVRALLEGEVLMGAHRHVVGGVDAFLGELHPGVRWDRSALHVQGREDRTLRPGGRGVVLVATAFAWPDVAAGVSTEGTPLVAFQARGTASLWDSLPDDPEHGLEVLLGRERAATMQSLRIPRSTTELATLLHTAPSSVSYHLAVLRQAGLVDSHREGRRVLYRVSPLGDGLLRLWQQAAPKHGVDRRRQWRELERPRGDLSKTFESFPLPRPPF
jgi:DNA-binding transcriptional ArsR family regulator